MPFVIRLFVRVELRRFWFDKWVWFGRGSHANIKSLFRSHRTAVSTREA